jgi:CheY-like chemotaxis protein
MSPVLALVDDLLFLSRVREAARATGVEVRSVRGAADTVAGVREGARLVVVDADSTRLPWRDAVAAVRGIEPNPGARVVAFVSHVHADHAAAARAAGCDRVLARSAFVLELPALMAGAATSPTVQEEPTP